MAVIILNARGLLQRVDEFDARPPANRPKLYALLLFDERESQRPVAQFAADQFEWLDQLAGSARIVLFMFIRPDQAQAPNAPERDSHIVAVASGQTVQNPSLRVATAFDVRPRQLPGILFFTRLEIDHGPNEGLLWPIPLRLFEGDRRLAENEFAQLVSFIQEAVPAAGSPEVALAELNVRLEAARRERFLAPVFGALRNGLIQVVKFPGALVEAMGEAWAAELARRVTQ
jgi:hypothetical protein